MHGLYKYPQLVLPEHAFNTSSSPCSYIHSFVTYGATAAVLVAQNSHNQTIKHQIKKLIIRAQSCDILWAMTATIPTLCCLKSCPLGHRRRQTKASSCINKENIH